MDICKEEKVEVRYYDDLEMLYREMSDNDINCIGELGLYVYYPNGRVIIGILDCPVKSYVLGQEVGHYFVNKTKENTKEESAESWFNEFLKRELTLKEYDMYNFVYNNALRGLEVD